jgi:hypothetical protein
VAASSGERAAENGATGSCGGSAPTPPGVKFSVRGSWRCLLWHLYGGFTAGPSDMKRLVAYSSAAHMGFVTPGIFLPNSAGGGICRWSITGSPPVPCSLRRNNLYLTHPCELAAASGI